MSLANLLQRGLDLADGIALEVFDFLERRSDDTKCLGLDSCGRQQLIDLRILGLETFLDSLVLLLKNEVPDTRLLMDFINQLMELIEELLLLSFEVLILLQSHLILPVDVTGDSVVVSNVSLSALKLALNAIVLDLLLLKLLDESLIFSHRLKDSVVIALLSELGTFPALVFSLLTIEVTSQLVNNIKVSVGDLDVVGADRIILDLVLVGQLLDCRILLLLNLLDGGTSFAHFLFTQQLHLMLELEMDLIADALVSLTSTGLLAVLVTCHGVEVLLVAHLLLLLGHVDGSEILLELTLIDPVLILDILKSHLSLFLQLSQLIEVLEDEMLAALFVDLLLDLMLFCQVLEFTLLVSQLGLLVFELLLADEPEVVDT